MNNNPEPNWFNHIPSCTEDCKFHDGKRCQLMGYRPDGICEPAVSQMTRAISRVIENKEWNRDEINRVLRASIGDESK